jgi:hypothetical protein
VEDNAKQQEPRKVGVLDTLSNRLKYHDRIAAAQPVSAPSAEAHDEIINARYEYALLAQRDESVEYGVSPGLVIELIDWLRTAREDLAAMTEDRDLWRYDHEGDCPVQAALEAEREARKQEAVEQFNAGYNTALKDVGQKASKLCGWDLSWISRALSKPVSGSPERLEEPGK